MYPPKFDYYRANSVDEAVALLQEHEGAKLLAGGHSLLPVMKLRLSDPGVLIDIGRISQMKGIKSGDGGHKIGALTTHSMIMAADGLPGALGEAAGMIGDPQVRNRGTVGGNIAHADPASDLPTVFTALNASFRLVGPNGARTVAADDFFTGLFETAMEEDEVLLGAMVPDEGGNAGSAYAKLFNPASRYAMVGAAVALGVENGTVSWARVAVGGLTPNAQRCPSVEAALVGSSADSAADAASEVANDLGDDVMGDIHASAEYRAAVCPSIVARAITKAVARAG